MKKMRKKFFFIRRNFRRKFGILKFPYFALKTRKKGQIFFIPNSAESAEFGAFGGLFRRFSYSRSAEIRRIPPKTHGILPISGHSHTTVFLNISKLLKRINKQSYFKNTSQNLFSFVNFKFKKTYRIK